ncbi:MAG TPA: HEAT repeat domain-containing protein, partial [Longimicrobiaceae bacterium]|nr:HEAT repeat domain-containing protein [Longimicrobiaceae bacterium]
LAFLLFKDGVRELSFYPGFERDDLDTFLALLAQVHRARPDEDDLLTLLWDHDWSALRYRYVEPLGEGVEVPQAEEGEPPAIESAAAELALVSSVSTDDFEAALYFLDEEELRRLEAELKGEMERDLWAGVLDALFDRLEDGPPARQEHVMRVLADILPTLLGAGKVETAAYFLGELVGVAAGGKMPAPVLRAVRALFDQLGAPETVAELVRTVEQAGSAIAPGSLGRLLAFFPPDSLGPLLRAGETSGSPGVRAQVQQSAERLADAHRDHLSRLVADADPYVAAGAARLLGRLRVAAASGEVARLLERPEAGLRLVAVEALQELRASSAAGALEAALDDPDRDVRVAAARALAALRYAPARPKLEAALDGKRLREADLTERIAFFEAYGGLAGGDGVALLDRVLNGKNWLGRRESPEMRACAALGLGRIRLPAAERALAAAAADPDPVVRSAVGRALRALKA